MEIFYIILTISGAVFFILLLGKMAGAARVRRGREAFARFVVNCELPELPTFVVRQRFLEYLVRIEERLLIEKSEAETRLNKTEDAREIVAIDMELKILEMKFVDIRDAREDYLGEWRFEDDE